MPDFVLRRIELKEFKDKVAVITGAASGIGFGLAERSAKEGMKVVLADVEESALNEAEKQIKELGAETFVVKTDVSKAEDVKLLADKTIDTFGKVHLLFNNAGVAGGSTAWATTLTDWRWILGVNLWGVIHGIHFFVPIMLKQNTECHIVNTASSSGLVSSTRSVPYPVSKHGIVALTESLYKQLEERDYKVGVSVLCPGFVKTRLGEADRNRPKGLTNEVNEGRSEVDEAMQAFMNNARGAVENGIPPQAVAEIVFDAIRHNKFYILPNTEGLNQMVTTRMEDILQERNPTRQELEYMK